MPISKEKSASVYAFAIALGSCCKLFTLEQVARHPYLRECANPTKKASEVLCDHAESFEKYVTPFGKPAIFRLSEKEARRQKIRRVSPASQKAGHWLAMTDLFITFTQTGGRPSIWIVEPKKSAKFDVFCVWGKYPYLIEVQKTPIPPSEWEKKWESRAKWYQEKGWIGAPWNPDGRDVRPQAVLVNLTGKPPVFPLWVVMGNSGEEVAKRLMRDRIRNMEKAPVI